VNRFAGFLRAYLFLNPVYCRFIRREETVAVFGVIAEDPNAAFGKWDLRRGFKIAKDDHFLVLVSAAVQKMRFGIAGQILKCAAP